jgi:hypothetical protein
VGYGGHGLSFLDCFPVRYDKGTIQPRPDDDWRIRLSFGQKPPAYREEHEFRCAVVLEGPRQGAPAWLDLVLPSPETYCQLLSSSAV